MGVKLSKEVKVVVAFILLFVVYHAAEYMIVFENHAVGFFGFQLLFFVAAWALGNWYSGQGLAAWALSFQQPGGRQFLLGMLLGIVLYALPFGISLALDNERITQVPDFLTIVSASLPFAIGVFFSSLAEDVLTRGLVFGHLNHRLKPLGLMLLSATVYLLNHIYRLTDGPETWSYLFLLGVLFLVPILFTRSLWLTAGMHWAGNTFFFITHSVIQTKEGTNLLPANYLFAACIVLLIPPVWVISKKMGEKWGGSSRIISRQ